MKLSVLDEQNEAFYDLKTLNGEGRMNTVDIDGRRLPEVLNDVVVHARLCQLFFTNRRMQKLSNLLFAKKQNTFRDGSSFVLGMAATTKYHYSASFVCAVKGCVYAESTWATRTNQTS